jgi:hypothetical protein
MNIKQILMAIIVIAPVSVFAATMQCPNNGNILQSGSSIAQVTAVCGAPQFSNSYVKTVNSTQVWSYYKPQVNGTNEKITLTFINNILTNINVISSFPNCNPALEPNTQCLPIESNLQATFECGSQLNVGANTQGALAICGNPAEKRELQNVTANMTELKYQGAGQNTLVFKDGMLVDWIY